MFCGYGDVSNLDESEIIVDADEEIITLDQLEWEEEEDVKKKYTQTELYDPEELEPTELEE